MGFRTIDASTINLNNYTARPLGSAGKALNDDQDRESVQGLTSADFDHVGTSTLRNWLKYWEGVLAGTQTLNPQSNDTADMAPTQVAKLTNEIDTRVAEGYAGPSRYRSWDR